MKFALRRWRYAYKKKVKQIWKTLILYFVAALIIALLNAITKDIFTLPYFLLSFVKIFFLELVVYYGYVAVKTVIDIKPTHKYAKMFNDKGYCKETFDYFYQNYIQSEYVNEVSYLDLTEHYRRMGDYDSALNTIALINIPESKLYFRSIYIFLFMKVAVSRNDTVLADKLLDDNQNFIKNVISDENFGERVNLLYLAMIYADCVAGRYEHALEICDSFLAGEQLKKDNVHTEKFLVIKIYLLKKLSRKSETDAAVTELERFAMAEWKPFYDFRRDELRIESEKAIKGELPV